MVEVEDDRINKDEDIVVVWISSDFEDIDNIYSILADEDKCVDPLFYLSSDNVNNLLSIIKVFFGNGYTYE